MDIGHSASTPYWSVPNVYTRESTPPNGVSWQVAFWILVPVAINTMAQPCGKVCGLPSRYGIYLRSSPVMCAADLLSASIHMLVNKLYLRASWRASLGLLMRERFKTDEPQDGQEEGLGSLEKWTWIRWLFFILGTLPPAIKLASMQGLPWTKTWGMLFLGSFGFFESLVIIATFNQSFFTISESGQVTWPGYVQHYGSTSFQASERILKMVDLALGGVALTVHTALMYWTYVQTIQIRFIHTEPWMSYGVAASGGFTIQGYLITALATIVTTELARPSGISHHIETWVLVIMLLVVVPNQLLARSLGDIRKPAYWARLLIPHVSPFLTAFLLIRRVGRRFPFLGRNLLIVYPAPLSNVETLDNWACLALVFFLQNVGLSVFWYAYAYDPTGTVNPSWTGVFG